MSAPDVPECPSPWPPPKECPFCGAVPYEGFPSLKFETCLYLCNTMWLKGTCHRSDWCYNKVEQQLRARLAVAEDQIKELTKQINH